MRILLFCSWLILLGALEEPNWSKPAGQPCVNATYNDFRKRHIDPKMTAEKCDSEIKRKQIYNPDNSCKKTNTFILATATKVKAICEDQNKNEKTPQMTLSKEKFRIVVCKLRNNVKKPRCEYRGTLLTNRVIEVSCVGGLPVHYEKHL